MPRRIRESPLNSHDLDSFHAFPPAIQRKYFSSLERLRIAQGASVSRTKPASSHGIAKSLKPATPTARPSLVRRNSSYFRNSPFLLRKSCSPTNGTFSHSDAQWFQRLPAKVQRRHFTEEEQTFLSGLHPQPFIPDAADCRIYELKRYLEVNRSVPTLKSTTSSSHSPRSSISTFEATDDMDDSLMDTFHCFDNDDDLDLASTLDDYHRFYAPEATKQQRSNHHPSFRKVMSLSSIPFQSTTEVPPFPIKSSATASPTPQQATTPISPSFSSHSRNFSRLQQSSSHKSSPSVVTLEPSATHYNDPSTRLKLRVYLSPSKFDEAIEFGFPSMEDADIRPLSRPSLASQRYHVTAPPCTRAGETPGKSFLDDSNPSIFDALSAPSSDEDETQSLPERSSPYTPQDSHFAETYLLSPSVTSQPSLPLPEYQDPAPPPPLSKPPFSKPVIRHDPSEPLAQVLTGNREMTLRMTLTRPDLRADEKELYKRTSGDDPLALAHLPVMSEKGADIWDTLPPVKESGLRRIWRKVSGKGA